VGWRIIALLSAGAFFAACTSAATDSNETTPPTTPSTTKATASDPEAANAPDTGTVRNGLYDWSRAPIGAGGFVTGMVSATDGAVARVYARTDVGGAYRRNSETKAWEQMLQSTGSVDDGFAPGDYSVASIAMSASDPDVVYIAVGNDFNPLASGIELSRTGRVLRSDDGGLTWTTGAQRWFVAGNQRFRTGTERLAVDPNNPERVVFGTQREGVWSSSDGGETWTQVPLEDVPSGVGGDVSSDQAGVMTVAFGPTNAAESLHVGVANVGVYTSFDDGSTWNSMVTLDAGAVPSGLVATADELFFTVNSVVGASAELTRWSEASGITTISTPGASPTWTFAVNPFDSDNIVLTDDAVRDGHLWTTSDGGTTWRTHDIAIESPEIPWLERTDLTSYMSAGRLMFDPSVSGRLWFAEGMGVWVTDDLDSDEVIWTSSARGIEELVVTNIITPPGGIPLVSVADRQGFRLEGIGRYPMQTLVDGRFASGSRLDYSGGAPEVVAWVGAESHLAGSPDRTSRGAVSVDGGRTWTEMEGLVPEMYGGEVAVSATDPDTIVWLPSYSTSPMAFQTDPVGLFVSNDGGRSWDRMNVDGDVHSFHRFFWWFTRASLAADRVNSNFYLMSDEERFYVSRDDASSWEQSAFAPPCSVEVDCHVFGQVRANPSTEGDVWASTGRGGLHRSSDAGTTPWERVPGLSEARSFAFGAPRPGSDQLAVYVHGRRSDDEPLGIVRSTDGGTTWAVLSSKPYDLSMGINTLAADLEVPGRIYVGFGGAGVVVGEDPEWR